ncbi:MAG: CBS domain containing-hemolysin-like protein [Myxococcota bacterium]|jgi:CBS domain containing-hemolysin-like protein
MIELILAIVLLLVASALASCTEVALFSVPYGQVLSAASQKKRGAAALLSIKNQMSRPIMMIVIINNISNIIGSIVVGALASDVFGSEWIGVFSASLTFLVIVFAEIIPKTIGDRYCFPVAINMAVPVLVVTRLFTPLIWVIQIATRPFSASGAIVATSEEEITALTRLGQKSGAIEDDESEMIQRVFRLNDISAFNIMTPVARVDALYADSTLGEIREELMTVTHTRLPVHEGSLNKVIGIVHLRDMLRALAEGKQDLTVREVAKEASFIPESATGDDLIRHFQRSKQHLAMVVDSYGTVLGVLSLEDALEELVGEIVDETDIEPEKIRRVSATEIVADATAEVKKINRALKTKIPEDGRIGEHIIFELGRIPEIGEVIEMNDVSITIDDASPRMVKRVRLKVL